MFKKITIACSLASLLLLPTAFAASKTTVMKDFKFDGDTIHTSVPAGWDAISGFLNVPVALVSPKGLQDQRSVIEIVPFGISDQKNDFAKIKKDPEEFYAQKEEWLEGMNGESISYEPFEETQKDGATITSVGIKYRTPMGEFLDKSYYVSTKSKQIYFIKTLVPLDLQNEHNTVVSEVVNTVSAKN
jgi:hypothetical protein